MVPPGARLAPTSALTLEEHGAVRLDRTALPILAELRAIAGGLPQGRAGLRLYGINALQASLAPEGILGAQLFVPRSRYTAEETIMPDQPNKPAGAFDEDGDPRPVEDQQAVKNQSSVEPEEYPEPAKGDTGERHR